MALIYLPKNNNIAWNDATTKAESRPINIVLGDECKDLRVYEKHGFNAPHHFTSAIATYVSQEKHIENTEEEKKKEEEGELYLPINIIEKETYAFENIKKPYNKHPSRIFKAAKCYTLCIPYPVMLNNKDYPHLAAYHLLDKISENGKCIYYRFVACKKGDIIKPNTPFLLYDKKETSSELIPMLQPMANIDVPVTPDISNNRQQCDEIYLCGTTMPLSKQDIKNKYLSNNEQVYILNNTDNTWYPIRNKNASIPPFRSFVQTSAASTHTNFAFIMEGIDNNNPSGRDQQVIHNIDKGISPFYALDGKYMGNNFDALPGGAIYIVNGKKIYKF